jgi:outer membrane protein assembly factor BamE
MIASLFFLACQTNQLKQFNTLQNGMDKDTVLESMGTPYSNVRSKGIDKWTYVFYENQLRYEKEVHFKTGNVVYVGEPKLAEVAAEVVDQKNADSENLILQELNRRKEENKNALMDYEEKLTSNTLSQSESRLDSQSGSVSNTSGNNNPSALNNSLNNSAAEKPAKKIKYAPKYEPIR